jgi:soluble lytic murein transglycosylase-like protein
VIYTQFDSLSASVGTLDDDAELASLVSPERFHETAMKVGRVKDKSLALYRSEVSKKDVIWFYAHITGDEAITKIILEHASRNNIPAALAFALSWEESRYQPRAVNKNANSIDRGLFQLNNKAFPNLTERDFFNPATNAKNGLAHLSYCIDLSGNEIAALAMYNAGTTKVRNNNTPKRTLDYVSRILSYREGLERLFNQEVASNYLVDPDEKVRPLGRK